MKASTKTKPPIVFVSYSHETPAQAKRVRTLADRLRQEAGCDTRLDQYTEANVANWPKWMRQELAASDFVLMVFTRTYRRRFDGEEKEGRGLGVAWEGTVISNQLYASGGSSLKFIPVVFVRANLRFVPRDLFAGTAFVVGQDWKRLVARLWNKPLAIPPPIASPPQWRGPKKSRTATPVIPAPKRFSESRPKAPQLSVLFVGAQRGTRLDLHYQLRQTRKAIQLGSLATGIKLRGVFDLTPDQMVMEISGVSPGVLHLSGKQEGGQIKMHDASGALVPVSADDLAKTLLLFKDTLRLVILDTCYSLPQARLLAKHIDCAIGVETGIAEPVAIDFFSMFFNALASGRSVQESWVMAYRLELSKINGNSRYRREIEKIIEEAFSPRHHLPQLVCRSGINPAKLVLVH